MKVVGDKQCEHGFTLIEMLAALGIFLVVTGAAFTLLTSSQQRYQTETQVLSAFQEARLGLDQMVRDVNDAGFPPPTFFDANHPLLTTSFPFGWSPGYTVPNSCAIGTAGGGTCLTPTDFDIIVETVTSPPDPACPGSVEWIRYQLGGPNGTTLMRGVACKQLSHDPAVDTSTQLVPFVQNVVNNSPNLQIGQFLLSGAFPTVFPGGAPVPIFQYTCDEPSVSQALPLPTTACPLAAPADNAPANIRDVSITLIVAAPLPDSATGMPRLVQLSGRGRRINPNQ